jgi:Zn-dependent peptidase ImmA (M78 family)/transcriptional regulator with XRE-family HTH domain
MNQGTYGARLKALREARGLTQDEVARAFGFKDRQTVSAIEAGDRRLSAEELVTAVERFNVPLDYFTNPFLIAGEGRFSWRQANVPADALNEFEQRAGQWVGAYRELSRRSGSPLSLVLPRVGLSRKSSFENAAEAGERVATELGLGEVPSRLLPDKAEEKLNTLVLMVDALNGVSGAACQLPEINAVLINRHEPEGRRNFDLAHEIFHVLTWDAMPPDHLDGTSANQKRVEQLAENFAAGLLMPTGALDRLGGPGGDLVNWLKESANALGVSAVALKWRLVNAGRMQRDEALRIDDERLRYNGNQGNVPPAFSRRFLQVIATAILRGHVSVRRTAALLNVTIDQLAELFEAHGIERPFDL